MKESDISRTIQIAASKAGHRLFRNQVGKAELKDGTWVAFGLGEFTSDLIGIASSGKFLAVEVKTPKAYAAIQNGKYTKRTRGQQNFIDTINRIGGIAFFSYSDEHFLDNIITRL